MPELLTAPPTGLFWLPSKSTRWSVSAPVLKIAPPPLRLSVGHALHGTSSLPSRPLLNERSRIVTAAPVRIVRLICPNVSEFEPPSIAVAVGPPPAIVIALSTSRCVPWLSV